MHEEKNKKNHKQALAINAYVAGAGAFGLFFRWMQRQLAFDENDLPGKSIWNFVVPLSILIVGFVFLRFVDKFKNDRRYLPEEFQLALKNEGKLYAVLRWFVGGLMCVGALVILATCETDKNAVFLRIIALLAALTGVSFVLLLSLANRDREPLRPWLLCLCSLLPVLLFAAWLIFSYKENAINSVIWDFSIEIVTICFAMISFFRLAGFSYGQPNVWRAMFFAMFSAFLCFMSLADSRNLGLQIILFSAALMQVFYNWVLVANLQYHAPETRETPQDGFERLR